MTTDGHEETSADPVQDRAPSEPSRWNIPNALCAIRLVGSMVLIVLAVSNLSNVFVCLLVFLLMTDWADGKLAILLKQQTTFGARLDSVADFALYASLLFGLWWMKGPELVGEWPWILAAMLSYGLTSVAGWLKFSRLPSYHTRSAKTCWFLVSLAAVSLFADSLLADALFPGWSLIPLRVAAIGVVIANLEATAITFVLGAWRANVPSLFHAWKQR